MKRIILLSVLSLCFMAFGSSFAMSNSVFDEPELKIMVKNCEINGMTIFANRVEYQCKDKKHKYKVIGGNFMEDLFPFNFDKETIEVFGAKTIYDVWNKILNNVNNGIMKGKGVLGIIKYKYKAKMNYTENTLTMSVEIEHL